METLTTVKKMHKCHVSSHACKKFKIRFGHKRIGARKAKNQSRHKIVHEINQCIKEKTERIVIQHDGTFRVITHYFTAIIADSNPKAKVLTIY